MTFVLILVIYNDFQVRTATIEFSSYETCQTAGEELQKSITRRPIQWTCVKK